MRPRHAHFWNNASSRCISCLDAYLWRCLRKRRILHRDAESDFLARYFSAGTHVQGQNMPLLIPGTVARLEPLWFLLRRHRERTEEFGPSSVCTAKPHDARHASLMKHLRSSSEPGNHDARARRQFDRGLEGHRNGVEGTGLRVVLPKGLHLENGTRSMYTWLAGDDLGKRSQHCRHRNNGPLRGASERFLPRRHSRVCSERLQVVRRRRALGAARAQRGDCVLPRWRCRFEEYDFKDGLFDWTF